MTEAQIYQALTEIFRDFFANSAIELKPETTAKDVEGWDSLNHLSLMIAAENHFGIKLKTGEIEKLTKVEDLVAVIHQRLSA